MTLRSVFGFVGLAIGALGGWAVAQTLAPTQGAGWTGLSDPEEVIEARRVLMIELERQMKPVDEFFAGEPADPAAIESAASAMEAMLLAFPHLFPPTTNLYDPGVREPPTYALPAVWQEFDRFAMLAEAAETAAAAILDAQSVEAMQAAGRSLRAACDACHASFMRPYTAPQVTEEDLEFDFESVLPQE